MTESKKVTSSKKTEAVSSTRTPLQIVVLGMHRSGTSALTGALNSMGVYVGEEDQLTGKSWENPQGFFERRDARKICDALLHGSGADWWKVSAFEPDNVDFDTLRVQRPAIRELVAALDQSAEGAWALKEPRLCLLMPIFRSILTNPFAIVVVRHPMEVARSLRRRNGFPVQAGLALWEAYTVAALDNASRVDSAVVWYDELVENPEKTLKRLCQELAGRGLQWIDPRAGQRAIQSSLRRERVEDNGLSRLTAEQRELWGQLEQDGPPKQPAKLSRSAIEVLREFEADQAGRERATAKNRKLERELNKANATLKEQSRTLSQRQSELESVRSELSLREAELVEARTEAEKLATRLESAEGRKEELSSDLTQAQSRFEEQSRTLVEQTRELESARSELSLREAELAEARAEAERLATRLESAKGRKEELSNDLSQAKSRLEIAESSLDEAKKEISTLRQVHEKERQCASEFEKEYRDKASKIADLQNRLEWQSRQSTEKNNAARHGRVGEFVWSLFHPLQAIGKRSLLRRAARIRRAFLFDVSWYLQRNPDVLDGGDDPALHYIVAGGREGRAPHPLFDPDWYTANCQEDIPANITPLEHYLLTAPTQRISPHRLFDRDWYLEHNQDVAEAGIDPLEHFISFGGKEGRNPHPGFDASWYLSTNPDVAEAGVNPLLHYLSYGAAEGRDPSPSFSTVDYLAECPELVGQSRNPLIDYVVRRDASRSVSTPESTKNIAKSIDRSVDPSVPVSSALPLPAEVTIIVPVYNAVDETIRCVRSILLHTKEQIQLLIINDGSAQDSSLRLRKAFGDLAGVELVENTKNLGYTKTVNIGLTMVHTNWCVVINSDTQVPRGWLTRMLAVANEADDVAAVGPLSNAASWQSVPQLFDEAGAMANNVLPPDWTPTEFDALVLECSSANAPSVPILNGFCTLFRTSALKTVGVLDEENFPRGYGEENDLCLRLVDAGYDLKVADNVFVYHEKSKSFGNEQRTKLSAAGSNALRAKHGDQKVDEALKSLRNSSLLDQLRSRLKKILGQLVPSDENGRQSASVLFLMPVRGGGGGAHSIMQEVSGLTRLGLCCFVAVKNDDLEHFKSQYDDLHLPEDTFFGFDVCHLEPLINLARSSQHVVASVYHSVALAKKIEEALPEKRYYYYVQDYEPHFFSEGSSQYEEAEASYTLLDNGTLFAKTDWIRNTVRDKHHVCVQKVSPSLDHEVYAPKSAAKINDGRIRLAAMLRPETPRRGAERTVRLCSHLQKRFGQQLQFEFFGSDSVSELLQKNTVVDLNYVDHGVLTRAEVASILQRCDVFIDLSDYQAFGRTGLEAMACGNAVVLPVAGGVHEYAVHGENAIIVDTTNKDEIYAGVAYLLEDRDRLAELQRLGPVTASLFSIERAAVSEALLFLSSTERKPPSVHARRKVDFFCATSGAQRTPTGSAFVRMILPYRQEQIRKTVDCRFLDRFALSKAKTIFIQRDVPTLSAAELSQALKDYKRRGGRVLYDLDDDLFSVDELIERSVPPDSARGISERANVLVEQADKITVSTGRLMARLKDCLDDVELVPNRLDLSLWEKPTVGKKGDRSRPFVIGYFGTPTHHKDLLVVRDAVERIKRKFRSRVRFDIVGAYQHSTPIFGRRIALPRHSIYPNFVHWLKLVASEWDLCVIPLADDNFNASKSYLKFLEATALGCPAICSKGFDYDLIVSHGKTGWLSGDDTEAWYGLIEQVINSPEEASNCAALALKELRERHSISTHVKQYLKILG